MDEILLVALKTLGVVVGVSIGLVLGSLVAAIWLRLAGQWLWFGRIPYLTAFKSALISNLVLFTFNFWIAFNHGFTIGILNQGSPGNFQAADLAFAYSPTYFLYAALFGLLITAAIFSRTIPTNNSELRVPFSDSLALAAFYSALAFAFMFLLALLVFCIVAGLLAMLGT